jgi:hypothetical protein
MWCAAFLVSSPGTKENATMEPTLADREKLRRREEDSWCEETRFDRDYMERVLVKDFVDFGKSGHEYQRIDTLSTPTQSIQVEIPLPDFNM